MMGVGHEIRRAREARGITLMKATIVAREFGLPIGISSLSRFERDESPVPLGEFLCLSRALGIDPERVLARQPYERPISDAVGAELLQFAEERHLAGASRDLVAHVLGIARESAAAGDPLFAALLLSILRRPDAPTEAAAWMSDPALNLLAGRVALACSDGPLAMDYLRRAAWAFKQPEPAGEAPDAGPRAAARGLRALRAEILWAEAAILAGGHKSALSTLRRLLADRRPTGLDGWLACDVTSEGCARGGDLAEARRFLRRALARADRSPDLKLLTWYRAHRIESRFGHEDAAAHAASTARRVLAQEITVEVGTLQLAPLLGERLPADHDLVALRLLSLFD